MNPALTILILTVPVCALDCVDNATSISTPAKIAPPNFMARNKLSIVDPPVGPHAAPVMVREFSRPVERHSNECPLLGVKRTLDGHPLMSAFDPKRTSCPDVAATHNATTLLMCSD